MISIIGDTELKYFQLVKTEGFAKYAKDFADRVQKVLCEGYEQKLYEPEIVEKITNNLNGLSTSFNKVQISTKGIFIHGNRSQVEFEYYGKKEQGELGDLIFILSVIYKGRKCFEKFTISQFKKDAYERWDLSNRKQVYLLSRFPPFRGIKGSIIPMKEFNLPNYSGCLGSFNLLFRPGDFVFVSGLKLTSALGNRKSIGIGSVSKFCEQLSYYFIHLEDIEFFYFWQEQWKQQLRDRRPIPFFLIDYVGILGVSHSAFNVYDFVDKYLRGNIGELIYSYRGNMGFYNIPAFDFLQELLSAIMEKARRVGKTEILNFTNEFFRYPYGDGEGGPRGVDFDYEGGNIGIISTSINLGEGKSIR